MTDSVSNDVHTRIPADHARHDRLLVSRFAARDAYPTEAEEARALVESCAECAALAADIRVLMKRTRELPAPRRTRDFRLTAEQAESLRGSAFDRLLRRLAAPGLATLRPVAGVALSLGLLLAVVGSALPTATPTAGTLEAPVQRSREDVGGTPAAAPAEGGETPGELFAAGAEDQSRGVEPPAGADPETEKVNTFGTETLDEGGDATAETMRLVLVYGGLGFAAVSLAVLLLVSFARRRTHDRLLR